MLRILPCSTSRNSETRLIPLEKHARSARLQVPRSAFRRSIVGSAQYRRRFWTFSPTRERPVRASREGFRKRGSHVVYRSPDEGLHRAGRVPSLPDSSKPCNRNTGGYVKYLETCDPDGPTKRPSKRRKSIRKSEPRNPGTRNPGTPEPRTVHRSNATRPPMMVMSARIARSRAGGQVR